MKTVFILRSCSFLVLCLFIVLIILLWSPGVYENSKIPVDTVRNVIETLNYRSEWDTTQTYRITRGLAKAKEKQSEKNVTLVTQTSLNNIKLLKPLLDKWQGHASVAIFCDASEVISAILAIYKLRKCHSVIERFVSFHVVTYQGNGNIKYHQGYENYNCSFIGEEYGMPENYNLKKPYPVNLMRNVARSGVQTPFFLVIDVDMMPSDDLKEKFAAFVASGPVDNGTIYVVPAFEIKNSKVPRRKEELLSLIKIGMARPFYEELCVKCQSCVSYSLWMSSSTKKTDVFWSGDYSVTWTDPCEPFYIGHVSVPYYDESFVQYGFNRISQLCETYVAGFNMVVLDYAFVVHEGFKTNQSFHASKELEQENNRLRYRRFKADLTYKYPKSSRHC